MLKTFLLQLFLLSSALSFGQFFKTVLPSADFNKTLQKIVLDFRYDFKNIQGQVLEQTGDVDVYASGLQLPGTTGCKILRFHSVRDTTANWQAIVYKGDEYKDAVRAYQNMCRLIRKSQLQWIDRSNASFYGDIETPRENLRFTNSTLNLDVADKRYKDFRALVQLKNTFDGWEVQLNLNKKTAEE